MLLILFILSTIYVNVIASSSLSHLNIKHSQKIKHQQEKFKKTRNKLDLTLEEKDSKKQENLLKEEVIRNSFTPMEKSLLEPFLKPDEKSLQFLSKLSRGSLSESGSTIVNDHVKSYPQWHNTIPIYPLYKMLKVDVEKARKIQTEDSEYEDIFMIPINQMIESAIQRGLVPQELLDSVKEDFQFQIGETLIPETLSNLEIAVYYIKGYTAYQIIDIIRPRALFIPKLLQSLLLVDFLSLIDIDEYQSRSRFNEYDSEYNQFGRISDRLSSRSNYIPPSVLLGQFDTSFSRSVLVIHDLLSKSGLVDSQDTFFKGAISKFTNIQFEEKNQNIIRLMDIIGTSLSKVKYFDFIRYFDVYDALTSPIFHAHFFHARHPEHEDKFPPPKYRLDTATLFSSPSSTLRKYELSCATKICNLFNKYRNKEESPYCPGFSLCLSGSLKNGVEPSTALVLLSAQEWTSDLPMFALDTNIEEEESLAESCRVFIDLFIRKYLIIFISKGESIKFGPIDLMKILSEKEWELIRKKIAELPEGFNPTSPGLLNVIYISDVISQLLTEYIPNDEWRSQWGFLLPDNKESSDLIQGIRLWLTSFWFLYGDYYSSKFTSFTIDNLQAPIFKEDNMGVLDVENEDDFVLSPSRDIVYESWRYVQNGVNVLNIKPYRLQYSAYISSKEAILSEDQAGDIYEYHGIHSGNDMTKTLDLYSTSPFLDSNAPGDTTIALPRIIDVLQQRSTGQAQLDPSRFDVNLRDLLTRPNLLPIGQIFEGDKGKYVRKLYSYIAKGLFKKGKLAYEIDFDPNTGLPSVTIDYKRANEVFEEAYWSILSQLLFEANK